MDRNRVISAVTPLIGQQRIRRLLQRAEACKYVDWRVWDNEWGNQVIDHALTSGRPHAIGKLGSTELQAIRAFLRSRDRADFDSYTKIYRNTLFSHSGVYPDDPLTYRQFCEFMLARVLPTLTVVGIWFNWGEANIVRKYCRTAKKVNTNSLHAWYDRRTAWTRQLYGKRVLVVHPFEASIYQQSKRHTELWPNHPWVLPDCLVDVLPVPHYPILVTPRYRSWFETLTVLQDDMASRQFDIALIGAGAYSLPLAVHAFSLGRQAIHLGGALQFLFGIRGKRWDSASESAFYNEAWIRPLPEDTPPNRHLIEDGCYW